MRALCFRRLKKYVIILRSLPDIQFCFNLKIKPSCQTSPNAFEMLRKTAVVLGPSCRT